MTYLSILHENEPIGVSEFWSSVNLLRPSTRSSHCGNITESARIALLVTVRKSDSAKTNHSWLLREARASLDNTPKPRSCDLRTICVHRLRDSKRLLQPTSTMTAIRRLMKEYQGNFCFYCLSFATSLACPLLTNTSDRVDGERSGRHSCR